MVRAQASKHGSQIHNRTNISEPLFCAVRVTVMNESDVDVLCPKAVGPWNDHHCEDGIFDPSLPVSPDNERAMIQALNDTILSLISEMRGTDEEDAAILALSESSVGPARRSAIILRQREKVRQCVCVRCAMQWSH